MINFRYTIKYFESPQDLPIFYSSTIQAENRNHAIKLIYESQNKINLVSIYENN